ncbi:lytic transglycosylase domain-containing protein [Wenzhouxiangella sp. XN79A]|uniref:lytic transglycosylase domain-containing protein n=1 Tax=Wenzhouxiangella sp. XN79A TaxID=2724193 RepID=UPI00144A7A68|nr:lytic transglycosylase domain-containing protein [Wenzhouxiangella sp. XN79A]NKI35284.1 lytic transglycosylase domain-containing protein [Wenzhouxiangella sp. XN79A]
MTRSLLLPLLAVLLVATMSPTARADADGWSDTARWSEQRALFREAWTRAGRGDVQALRDAIARLGDYPLTPYLAFELRRQRLGEFDADSMSRFLARYRDWSFHDRLRAAWQLHLARTGRFDALERFAPGSDRAEVRCLLLRDRLAEGDSDGLVEAVRPLWLSPVSQHSACDPLFAWWRRQGQPDPGIAWERFGLAVEAGEYGLAGYLRRYLDPADRPFADGWLRLARRPSGGLSDALGWPDQPRARQLVAWGLHRLAASDWESALSWRQRFAGRMSFAADEIGPADRRIALFRAVDLDPGAIATIDALPDDQVDAQLLQWRMRVALVGGDWAEVLESIERMPAADQLDGRWRYWRGRALAALGRPEAGLVLATLAGDPDYYGFLAALKSGQPLTLCPRELPADGALQRRLLRDAEFERALELYRVGRVFDARWTWNRVADRLRVAELEQAALLAAAAGWHDRAIFALARAGALDAYPWRFPLLERERIEAHARQHGVDPALVLGLMRAESAMQPDARSSAGARGLLQLMDGTARATARRFGLPYRGPSDLYDASRNIALGVAHLGELGERFDGDFTRVAAAYNAGPAAAERWQQVRRGLPADIWIETLPFYETRDYVPRVLAFATVYEWQLGRSPDVLARHVLGQAQPAARFACPETAGAAAADAVSAQ